jgi:hypothetical protein
MKGTFPMFRIPPRHRLLFVCLLAFLAAEVVGGVRLAKRAVASARSRTTYTCIEGHYAFNGYIYNGSGQITGCNLLWQPDTYSIGGPYSSCAPNGVLHYTDATQGWNAYRGICYGAITADTHGPSTDHLTGVL